MEVVDIKKILVPNLLIHIYLHCVRSSSWCATTLATLLKVRVLQICKYISYSVERIHNSHTKLRLLGVNNSSLIRDCFWIQQKSVKSYQNWSSFWNIKILRLTTLIINFNHFSQSWKTLLRSYLIKFEFLTPQNLYYLYGINSN